MIINEYQEFQQIRKMNENKTIVFCSGSFDLTHAGHVLFFEDCKKQGDLLVVAVGNDANIKSLKGDTRPILNGYIRLKTIDSLKPVDYTILDKPEITDGEFLDALRPILENLKPDKWAVNEDAYNLDIWRRFSKEYGAELVVLKRWCPEEFEDISTSKIIDKVKSIN